MPIDALGSETSEPRQDDIKLIIDTLWEYRVRLLQLFLASAAAAIVISLLLPQYFKSTTTILPESDKSRVAGMGGITDFAAMAGVNLGGESSFGKLYPAIIRSESVLEPVIRKRYWLEGLSDSADLMRYWDLEDEPPARAFERALRVLRDELEVEMDVKSGLTTLSIETKDAHLSAEMLNELTQELDRFLRTKRTTRATEQRRWIEQRLIEVKSDLTRAEELLTRFRVENRRVTDSPRLLLQQERLTRDVTLQSTLFLELKKQHEFARIEEIKNLPVVNVIVVARPAAEKSKPKRSVVVLGLTFVSIVTFAAERVIRRVYWGRFITNSYFARMLSPLNRHSGSRD